jgi:hypothetical protein
MEECSACGGTGAPLRFPQTKKAAYDVTEHLITPSSTNRDVLPLEKRPLVKGPGAGRVRVAGRSGTTGKGGPGGQRRRLA